MFNDNIKAQTNHLINDLRKDIHIWQCLVMSSLYKKWFICKLKMKICSDSFTTIYWQENNKKTKPRKHKDIQQNVDKLSKRFLMLSSSTLFSIWFDFKNKNHFSNASITSLYYWINWIKGAKNICHLKMFVSIVQQTKIVQRFVHINLWFINSNK